MTTMTLDLTGMKSAASSTALGFVTPTSTNGAGRAPSGMPASVSADELFYWSEKWQADEAEAAEDYRRGNVRQFANGRDAANSLFSDD